MEKNDNMKTQQGIGHYKIRYEMDVKNSSRDQNYLAGIVAYTSEEAVNTLIAFGRKRVKGFKGLKVEEVAFEGALHDLSDSVKDAVIATAILEGKVVAKGDYDALLAEQKNQKVGGRKKSIIEK